jgi:predicted DNA-binding transcriptional regulator AlpA
MTDDLDAYTINEFCRRHGISRSTYYNAQRDGVGPQEMRLGNRVMISREAAERWRREREVTTADAMGA